MRHTRIPDSYVDRAAWLVDEAELVEHVNDLLALAPQGRPRRIPLRTILIGYFLAIQFGGSFKTTTCLDVLSSGISIEKQVELGTRWEGGRIRKSHIDYVAKAIAARGYSTARERAARGEDDLVTDEELARRARALDDLLADLLSASIIEKDGTGWYALDGTGLWAHLRSPATLGSAEDVRAMEDVADRVLVEEDGLDTNGRRWFGDLDATEGVKTAKRGGREHYYGYVLDAAVRTAAPNGTPKPTVLEALVVSPASTDVVAPSLALIDSLAARGQQVTDITVDRHYSYKDEGRWAAQLRRRGVSQHL